MDPLGRGRRRLEAKDYAGAVEAFTEVREAACCNSCQTALLTPP